MGTTREAFAAGSVEYRLVVAIEAYENLVSNCEDLDAVVAAWAGTDWVTAIGGLHVDCELDQALDPNEPFCKMGRCTIHVTNADGVDAFGIAVHRRSAGVETYLDSTLDCDDTTATVKATTLFAESGHMFIGTERIDYTGVTSTSFTGLTRGMYSPFLTSGSGRFAHDHRVILDANSVKLQPVVSEQPRHWIGRWVGVWIHRYVGGVLDTKAEAELLFGGRITEVRDDPNTFATVLELAGASEVLAESVLGGQQWEGTANDAVYLAAGGVFQFSDQLNGYHAGDAADLVVVGHSAAGAYQINQGYYSIDEIIAAMKSWLTQARIDGDLVGVYLLAHEANSVVITWTLNDPLITSFYVTAHWRLSMPAAIADFLGFTDADVDATNGNRSIGYTGKMASGQQLASPSPPSRVAIAVDGGPSASALTTTRAGVLVDQYATLPAAIRPSVSVGMNWGLFQVGDSRIVIAAWADDSTELIYIQPAFQDFTKDPKPDYSTISVSDVDSAPLTFRQIYAVENDPFNVFAILAGSTATPGFNVGALVPTYPVGAAIPYELIEDLAQTMTALPGGSGSIAVVIDKPTKFSELLRSDLIFRWMFLYWRGGGIQAGAWGIPTATAAVASLSDHNKAEPSGQTTNHRTPATEHTNWLRQSVKVEYNRNATDPRGTAYKSSLMFVDGVATDDAGGPTTTATISLRNVYSEFSASGDSVEAMLPRFYVLSPLISRPVKNVNRSIDHRGFFELGLGDVVLLTDGFVRDPDTGARGLTSHPVMITHHRFTLGGTLPASTTDPNESQSTKLDSGGEIDLFFTNQNVDRTAPAYVPAADVDDTYAPTGYTAGYDNATKTLVCYAHRYSEADEDPDATNFPIGYKVLVIERDPPDPDAPLFWVRTVSDQAGNAIVLDTALGSPAFDATKKYHVVFDDYDQVIGQQQSKAFQADEADGLILDATQPYLYGSGAPDSEFTPNALSEIEMPPNRQMVDGAGRDVAIEAALGRLANNLIDYKLAFQSPMLGPILKNTTHAGYLFVAYFPIFLSFELLSNSVFRYLIGAPWAWSDDGTPTKVRVTVSLERPSYPTIYDVPWSGTYSQSEWTGITSTSEGQLADMTWTANVKHPVSGQAWVSIELGYKGCTRGMGKFLEGARVVSALGV